MAFYRYIIALCVPILMQAHYFHDRRFHSSIPCCSDKEGNIGYRLMQTTSSALKEFVMINRNFFTLPTVKVLTAFIPPYLVARKVDHNVHHNFYDEVCHKNRNQLPHTFTKVVSKGGDIGIVLLTLPAFISSDCRLQTTSRIFVIGAVSGLIFKDLIKSIAHSKCAMRPFNESFEKKRVYGGFPSGHMIEAAYMATFWGLQYGYKIGLPLGIFAGFMFGTLVNSNRHYASQVVAGAAVGIAYGIAASAVVDQVLRCSECVTYAPNDYGTPGLKVSYKF